MWLCLGPYVGMGLGQRMGLRLAPAQAVLSLVNVEQPECKYVQAKRLRDGNNNNKCAAFGSARLGHTLCLAKSSSILTRAHMLLMCFFSQPQPLTCGNAFLSYFDVYSPINRVFLGLEDGTKICVYMRKPRTRQPQMRIFFFHFELRVVRQAKLFGSVYVSPYMYCFGISRLYKQSD